MSAADEFNGELDALMGALPEELRPTVAKFLDGEYLGTQDRNAQYHPGNVVLWPAFSSTTFDRRIALGYSTRQRMCRARCAG